MECSELFDLAFCQTLQPGDVLYIAGELYEEMDSPQYDKILYLSPLLSRVLTTTENSRHYFTQAIFAHTRSRACTNVVDYCPFQYLSRPYHPQS